jgi:hypothetical protein
MSTIRVVSIKSKGLPTLCGEPCELQELFDLMFEDGPPAGTHIHVKFQDMDEKEFDKLPDWNP